MSFIPKPHEIYKHFKGNLYQITAVAKHTETGEQLVIYQALYGDFGTYARPLDMFVSRVDRSRYPDVEQEFRFALQGPEAGRQAEESDPAERREQAEAEGPEAKGQDRCGEAPDVRERREQAEAGRPEAKGQDRCGEAPDVRERREQAEAEGPEAKGQEPEPEEGEEFALDPMLLQFLDADSYEERLNILAWLHHQITDDMITTMAIACDVEIDDGDLEERYEALKACLLTLQRYECCRIR